MKQLGEETVDVDYTNHQGVRSTRRVLPLRIWYGVSGYHPSARWFLHVWDFDRAAARDFCIEDIHGWKET